MKYFNRITLTSFTLLLLAMTLGAFTGLPGFAALVILSAIVMSLVRRDVAVVLLTSMLIGFLFEELGVHTGLPFGHYTYNFPPYLLSIPVFVILGWGVFSVICYYAVMDLPTRYRLVFFPLMMTAIDVSLDPQMVHLHFWTWEPFGPEWYGVPLTNFLGWYVVSLIIITITTIITRDSRDLRPVNPYFIIPYFLLVILVIPPVLLTPFITGAALAGVLSMMIYLVSRRVNARISQ